MDLIDDILDTLSLKGALYFRTDFSPPWSVTVPDHPQAARFHLVIQGHCHVTPAGGETVALGPGDLILIPRGRRHILAHEPSEEAPPLESVLEQVGYTGDGVLVVGHGDTLASTKMVCGHFSFRKGADHPLLRALPDYLVTSPSERAQQPMLDEALRLISQRIFADSLGSAAAVTRLSEIVFIELLRSGIAEQSHVQPILEAFRDPNIGRSLELIHTQPAEPWTVASLAAAVAMSRSRFANRFSQLIGSGPMSYLAEWRLQKALSLLDDRHKSVQEVANETGYQSPSAFSRAFTGKFGFPPSDYRRKAG